MKWECTDTVVNEMIKGSTGELWGKRLEQSDHYPILRELLETAGQAGTLIDVGCGAGDVSRSWKGDYIGVDLDWVIEKVSKVCNPDRKFLSTEITQESFKNFPRAEVIFMNAFLDVLENPHEVFDAAINSNCNKVIVHRQRISQDESYCETSTSYGGTQIPSSVMSLNKIISTLQKFPNAEFAFVYWQRDVYSFIVVKNEIC